MARSTPCADEVLDQADSALTRMDRLKGFLVLAAKLEQEDHAKWHFLSQEARAAAIVGMLAELEALTRTFLTCINTEINLVQPAIGDLRPCLRGLAGHTQFESLRDSWDSTNIWARRATVTMYEASKEAVSLPIPTRGPMPPLDGKTLTPSHLQRIWQVYGLKGNPVPDLSAGQTLQKLAGLRNDIAHGNLPFAEIFRTAGTTVLAVEGYLGEMSLLAIHLATTWASYAVAQDYFK